MLSNDTIFVLAFGGAAAAVMLSARLRRGKHRSASRAINVVGGRVLPVPDDPRWKKSLHGFKIGPVVVTSTKGLIIDGNHIFTDEAERYAAAAYRVISARLLERAEAATLQKEEG